MYFTITSKIVNCKIYFTNETFIVQRIHQILRRKDKQGSAADRLHVLRRITVCGIGKKAAVGNINGNEIDFIALNKDEREYYQVTMEMLSPGVKERETRSLKMVKDNFQKTIITLQRYPSKNIDGIKVVALVDFLLEDI